MFCQTKRAKEMGTLRLAHQWKERCAWEAEREERRGREVRAGGGAGAGLDLGLGLVELLGAMASGREVTARCVLRALRMGEAEEEE